MAKKPVSGSEGAPERPSGRQVERLFREIESIYGAGIVSDAEDLPDLVRVSSGILKLDEALGGGWPLGRIIEIWGGQSVGKSTLALRTVAAIQRSDPEAKVAYFDLENTFSKPWAKMQGVDLKRLKHVKAIPAEKAGDLLVAMVKERWAAAIVDSVVEMLPEKELKKSVEDDSVAPVPRVLAKLLPKITVLQSTSPTLVIILNQVRDKIGFFFGETERSPGGHTLWHLDSIKLKVARAGAIKEDVPGEEKPVRVGYEMAIRVIKSKVGMEGRETRLQFRFGRGIVDE